MVLQDKRVEYGDSAGNMTIVKETGKAHRLDDVFVDSSVLTEGAYMDIIVGTRGLTRLPLNTGNYNLIGSPAAVGHYGSIMSFIRQVFGETVFVEADEDEDILIQVRAKTGGVIDISKASVAVYEDEPTGIDKSLLMRSACEDFVITPFIWKQLSVTADDAAIDTSSPLDNVLQMEGLPEVKDGYVIPAALEFVIKALVLDGVIESAGTIVFDKAFLHLKDLTYEFFSPLKYDGLRAENNLRNIARFSIDKFSYLSGEDYVISGGHELSMVGDFKGSGTGVGITTTIRINFVPIMLMRKVA